jgi:hypothetical protein
MRRDMLRDVAAYLCPRAEQLIHANCRFQRSGSPQKGPLSDPHMLQAFAAFAVLRRSAYPVVEL